MESSDSPSAERSRVGDTVENPIWITEPLEFYVEGSTCGFTDDYDEACPYQNSTSPDVVYAYQVSQTEYVHIDLCGSSYDTKVYVYEDVVTPGNPLACNDDACGPDGYRSRVEYVELRPGHVYYIIVDGYGGSCGEYELFAEETWECAWCSDDAIQEGEPDCHDGYVDTYNAGCDTDPPMFVPIPPSEDPEIEICGRSGAFEVDGADAYDTDWYEINLTAPRTVQIEAWAAYYLQIDLVDGRNGCAGMEVLESVSGSPCGYLTLEEGLSAGTYWIVVHPLHTWGVWCGETYQLLLHGYTPDPAGSQETSTVENLGMFVYPNPFAEGTYVRFALRRPGPVTVELFDFSGRLASRPLSGVWLQAGAHTVRIEPEATDVASWFCRVRTPEGSWSRRIVRLK